MVIIIFGNSLNSNWIFEWNFWNLFLLNELNHPWNVPLLRIHTDNRYDIGVTNITVLFVRYKRVIRYVEWLDIWDRKSTIDLYDHCFSVTIFVTLNVPCVSEIRARLFGLRLEPIQEPVTFKVQSKSLIHTV